tara:strand:+ start:668 stop:913 length:246 start_codon:yes stop_codon:yes gene_type:complete
MSELERAKAKTNLIRRIELYKLYSVKRTEKLRCTGIAAGYGPINIQAAQNVKEPKCSLSKLSDVGKRFAIGTRLFLICKPC